MQEESWLLRPMEYDENHIKKTTHPITAQKSVCYIVHEIPSLELCQIEFPKDSYTNTYLPHT